MTRATWGARLRYEFDKSMAAGPIALIGWLAVVTLVIVAAAGAFLAATRIAPQNMPPEAFVEAFWQSAMRAMDPGTLANDNGWGYRLVMLLVTLAGLMVFSALIGVLSAGLNTKLDQLRKGRSQVLENGHTVIFNWSPSIFDIISELAVANDSQKRPRIVIMADKDKVQMEDEIAAKVPHTGKTRVICRSGDPTDPHDLPIVSPHASKSIIVLAPTTDDPDSQVIKTVLALVNDPRRRAEPYRIAAEIRDPHNAEVARVVGGDELQLVLADDLISRILVHSSRQLGLSDVYSELLDFDGCEIYTTEQPSLVGMSFGDAMLAYESSTLIGLCGAEGRVRLNPPMDTVIQAGDRGVIIAEDDAAIAGSLAAAAFVDEAAIRQMTRVDHPAERLLILGWNRRGPTVVTELSRYVATGSVLTIAADSPNLAADIAGLVLIGDNMRVEHRAADTSRRSALQALDISSYDSVMVLSYSDDMPAQSADTRTLVTLLHLRKIADAGDRHIGIVSEMADIRNRELAAVTRADDFVVSNRLVSLMLAQASENPYLSAIFADLLDEQGSEICMRSVQDYVSIDGPVTFSTIAEAARRRGEVAFGYRRQRPGRVDRRNMNGVVVNPPKSQALDFEPADRVIVLARELDG